MATVLEDTQVMTLAEIAEFLRVSEPDVLDAIAHQALPGKQFKGEWRFLKSAVEAWLGRKSPKDELLSQAGALKDDPYLEQLMKNIEAERERQRDEGV
jgi:excisionase family DNA binding protein